MEQRRRAAQAGGERDRTPVADSLPGPDRWPGGGPPRGRRPAAGRSTPPPTAPARAARPPDRGPGAPRPASAGPGRGSRRRTSGTATPWRAARRRPRRRSPAPSRRPPAGCRGRPAAGPGRRPGSARTSVARPFGRRHVVAAMATPQRRLLTALGQPFPPVLADRLQQPEADLRRLSGDHHRLGDEAGHQVEHRVAAARRPRTPPRPPPGRSPVKTDSRPTAVARPASTAKLQSTSARSVCWRGRRGRARAAGQQREPVVQPRRDLVRRAAPAAGRRPARSPAGCRRAVRHSRHDAARSPSVTAKPGCDRAARSTNSSTAAYRRPARSRRDVASGSGSGSGGTASSCSPATPSGCRLVASTRSAGCAASRSSTSARARVEQVLAVVQHQQRPPAAQVVDQRRASAGRIALGDAERGGHGLRHQAG